MADENAEYEFLEKAVALKRKLKKILGKDISFKFEASDDRPEGVDPDYVSFRKEDQELARLYWLPNVKFNLPMYLQVYADEFDEAKEIEKCTGCKVEYAGG